MHRLKHIQGYQHNLELYYSGDNLPRVVPVYTFFDMDEQYVAATNARREYVYNEFYNDQPLFYIHETDIEEIEPFDITDDPDIVLEYGKATSDKEPT